jgi:DNA polymerase III epsilon subunit-like protein
VTRIVFIDCETVSIDPGPLSIWELAIIEREMGAGRADSESLWQIRPDLHAASAIALGVGGYYERCTVRHWAVGEVRPIACPTDEFPDEKPLPIGYGQLAASLASRLAGATLIAANPTFDAGHLAAFLHGAGECLTADYHYLDIGSMVRGWAAAQGMLMPYPLKLAQAARAAGIDPQLYDVHTALSDARLVRDVFDAVMAGGAP